MEVGGPFRFGIMFFEFLSNPVHGLRVFALLMRSRYIMGHHTCCPNSVMPHAPVCVARRTSITGSFMACRMAILLSTSKQPLWVLCCATAHESVCKVSCIFLHHLPRCSHGFLLALCLYLSWLLSVGCWISLELPVLFPDPLCHCWMTVGCPELETFVSWGSNS